MNFKDLLNRPLPSQSFTEGTQSFDDFMEGQDIGDEDIDLDEGSDDDFEMDDDFGDDDYDSMSFEDGDDDLEDDLEDLDDELDSDENFDDADMDDIDDADDIDDIDDDEPAEPLTGEADKKADNMMAVAATPMLIRDELTAEECADFFNSSEAEIAVSEGFLMESDIDDVFEEGVFANPNKPFKMTKQARFKQLYELSLQIEARQHNDPKYKTLQKAYKIERTIKSDWRKKYHALAMKRAKKYLKKLMSSKSPILNSIGKKLGFKK